MSRRRTRYLLTMADGTIAQGLAYSPAFYADKGVLRVEPYKAGLARLAREQRRNPWRLDEAAIAEAKEFFGLRLPVRIILEDTLGSKGLHTLTPVGGMVQVVNNSYRHLRTATGWEHVIRLATWQDADDASRSLWHELTHAMQAERFLARTTHRCPVKQHDGWRATIGVGRVAYDRRPVEHEAKAHEVYAVACPLVVQAGVSQSVATRTATPSARP